MDARDNQHYEQVLKKLTAKERLIFYEIRDAKSWQEWNESQRNLKIKNFVNSFFNLNNEDVEKLLYQIIRSFNSQINFEKAIRSTEVKAQKHASNIIEIRVDGVSVCKILNIKS